MVGAAGQAISSREAEEPGLLGHIQCKSLLAVAAPSMCLFLQLQKLRVLQGHGAYTGRHFGFSFRAVPRRCMANSPYVRQKKEKSNTAAELVWQAFVSYRRLVQLMLVYAHTSTRIV